MLRTLLSTPEPLLSYNYYYRAKLRLQERKKVRQHHELQGGFNVTVNAVDAFGTLFRLHQQIQLQLAPQMV